MDRKTNIAKLREKIAAGNLVTVAGTGVSVAACGNQAVEGFKVATWTGLLHHGVKHCKDIGAADESDVELLNMQIKSGKTDFLINAAETISQRMKQKSDGVFRGWLKDTVGKLTIKDRTILDALAALPGVLATLNYDNLIEDGTGRNAVTWLKTDDVQEVLARVNTEAILHLHGWFKEPESVVLGLSSYLAVKDHPHAKAVLNLFTMDRTLLFVGCGDTVLDPNFTRLIEWGKEALKDVAPRHYLLCRSSEVDNFQKKLDGAPWLQPLGYGADHKDLVPFLRSLVPAGGIRATAVSRPATRASFDLTAYQQAMRKRYARLKLEDLDTTTHDVRPLTLTGMFIEQSARETVEFMPRVFELPKELQRRLREQGEMEGSELDEELLAQHRRAYLDQSPRRILEIVRDPAFPRLVILGDPGSGKSTLLQYLLLEWAEKAAPDLAGEPLPLLIELREYAQHDEKVNGFLGYLQEGANVRWHLDRVQIDAWLKANPSLILFDGLDEVFDPVLRKEISTTIHRFADEYPLAGIIVTSRIIGYQHQAWRDEGFRQFMLQDLDEEQIADFVTRWHRAAYEETSKGEAKRALLAEAIEHSTAIRQLAGNPLLLTMMAILNRTQDLPRDRAELYEQCARLLLHQWKVDVAFAPDPELAKASLDYKDKRGLLLSVARAMQFSERGLAGNLIDEDTLERTLADGLKGVPNLRPDRAARALIEQLRGRNFMLCSVGGNSYAFVHRTFLEYFCAAEIRERFQVEQSLTLEQLKTEIFGHWADETWHEVLTLLAGMLAPKFLREILEWLLEQPDPDDTCQHVFLAARCVGEVRRREELGAIEKQVLERVRALTRFDLRHYYEPWDDEVETVTGIRTRAVEMVAVVWREAADTRAWLKAREQSDADADVRQSALRELARGWKDAPETFPILKARVQSDENWEVRQSALRELARGWKDASGTLPILKARAQSDESWKVRQSAVRELAQGWKDDPETLLIFKERAHSDEDYDVRQSAVQELARGWKDDPETLPWLKNLAQSEEDFYVRQSAVQELARGWKDDPETLPILKERVQSDEDADVRQSAVQELARRWKDDPETLPWLKNLVQSEADADVRQSAVQELARGWKDDPETLPILQERASSDAYWQVRESAVKELARRWKDDPETLPILRERAQSDEDAIVRESAVRELARGWKDDAETLPLLKAHAQLDQNADLRQSAVQELVGRWKDDPETLPWLKARVQSDEDAEVRKHAVRELARGWKDDAETLQWLKAWAQSHDYADVRQSAVQELARGWKDDPEILPWLKGWTQFDRSSAVRRSAMRELVRGWKDDSETLPILKAVAQSDKDAYVRESGVQELARGWKEDPETLLIIKTRAQSDDDADVRRTAVQELARGWKDDPETLPILKARAQSEKDAYVRLSAVRELAEGWKDQPETLPWLKARAQSDKDAEVRRSAVQELARGWKDDPETLPWLKARAQSDKDAGVRRSAVRELARWWKDDPAVQTFLKALE